ncbi:MAG: YidC/Oxa1 family membrane protein insertase [Thermoanaerobaculia bacterium]|nr:YidC/Oxa1 family membrane protein insertase [Thermoanaerobaculia bacterium]
MTSLLETIFLLPLSVIYDWIFRHILVLIPEPGSALIAFSCVLNLLLLPLYFQMEINGRKSLALRRIVDDEVARIKATYSGRERYFYTRAVHRTFGYKPISAVLSSGDLYLQILVFATVYHYISKMPALVGSSYLGIPDLSRPDELLFGANFLPFLMTVFNMASALAYDADRSKRRQAFILAAVFLVLLYNSPSGLLLYWTSNNLFSLVRNLTESKLTPRIPPRWRARIQEVANQR